ncbi:DUF397 domain-containing protein [Kitasatospora sp. NBC_01287]|uniref:DUF397 domain-containing protein n=1 Tax=Kitasatospora sp. NBC_01287 TaxID=2903573 RepID=UPI0022502F22|nr:DUF397 domain-containing protein [Kitasatospora sp. NBC_01287]MCX4750296.1 DUF397 domain-containing protein [Kitasatospora sp. NBC_01287]
MSGCSVLGCGDRRPVQRPALVRDSKDPDGPTLVFRSHAFATFVASLSDGGLDATH